MTHLKYKMFPPSDVSLDEVPCINFIRYAAYDVNKQALSSSDSHSAANDNLFQIQEDKYLNDKKTSVCIKRFHQMTALEIYKILKLRQDIFIIEGQTTYEDIDNLDLNSIHIWSQDDISGAFLSYIRIVPIEEKSQVSIGRVLTSSSARGKGIARQLMEKGITFALTHFPKYDLVLSAKQELCPFYESLSFIKEGPVFHYPKGDPTPIFPMRYNGNSTEIISQKKALA